jgi:hypothetical protein
MGKRGKSFDDWTTQEIRLTFNIEQVPATPFLKKWLAAVHPPNAHQTQFMEAKRALLERFYRNWNEDELKFQFIAQIVELVDLHGKNFNIFSQRNLSAVVNGITLQGRPEVMVATGQEDPLSPYFFIHEYKPSKRADEPLGQVLAAMVAAQALNADEMPVLGCFVIGALWQFVVLEGKTYTLSSTYDATQTNDLHAIYSAFYEAKLYIEEKTTISL